MTTLGLNFDGVKRDKNDNEYFIIQPVKDIIPFIIDDKKLLCFRKVAEPKSDKSPKWVLDSFIPKKNENNESINTPKIPL